MLKPSEMGITGVKQSIAVHKKKVMSKLDDITKINKNLGEACKNIMNTPNGGQIDVSKLKTNELSSIKNYFAEVMGPIWAHEHGLVPGLKGSDHTFFSNSDTERLYDFKVYRGGEEILISNKQKTGGTNTLKPGDVVRLVNENRSLSDKWGNTKYYKIFDILDKSNVVSGPIKAVAKYYQKAVPAPPGDLQKVITQLTKNDVVLKKVPKSIMKMINADPTAAEKFKSTKKVTGSMINFIFEKILIEQSVADAKYNDLFVDVTDGNILFLKFDLSNKVKVSFNIDNPRTSKKRAKLRSKQGVERRSSSGALKLDKLGFQP